MLFSFRPFFKKHVSTKSKRRSQRNGRTRNRQPLCLELLEDRTLPSAYVVTTTADSGPGSLRDAINAINTDTTHTLYPSPSNSSVDEIDFNITAASDTGGGFNAGTGVATITPSGSLPTITNSAIMNGYSQAGAQVNTLSQGDNAVLKIQLDFSAIPVGDTPLIVAANNSTIEGLVVNGVAASATRSTPAIYVTNTGNQIQGNFIGTDVSGTQIVGNASWGVQMAGSNNVVGGTTPAARNIISGNGNSSSVPFYLQGGIQDLGTADSIEGNYIGTDVTGTKGLGNGPGLAGGTGGEGVDSQGVNGTIGGTAPGAGNLISGNNVGVLTFSGTIQGNLVGTDASGKNPLGNNTGVIFYGGLLGGTTPAAHNIISGNGGAGIFEDAGSSGQIEGNYIGTDISGTMAVGNNIGIFMWQDGSSTVGGSGIGQGNLISGNAIGIRLHGSGNQILGNLIGTDLTGTNPLPNQYGIYVTDHSNNNVIGGTQADAGNTMAYNSVGVALVDGTGNAVLGNSIHDNSGGGINLSSGANNNQAAPLLISAIRSGTGTAISGTLAAYPSTSFRIEFFSNQTPDPSGYGEGQTFLGYAQVTTNGSGNFSANLPSLPLGTFLSATATDAVGDTSGFAADITVKATLTLVTNSNLMLVGSNPPPLTGSVNGAHFTSPFQYHAPFGDTFTITLSTTATSASAVDQYPITAMVSGANLGNYVILPIYGTMYVVSVGADPSGTGAQSVAFWDNKGNKPLITAADLSSLDALNLVSNNGKAFDPNTVAQLQAWLSVSPNATTSYQLAVQLAVMDLNELAGYVHATDLVYAGALLPFASAYGITGLTSGGFIDVQYLMQAANAALALDPQAVSGDANQAYEAALTQVFQMVNANNDFVQQELMWNLLGVYNTLTS